MTTIIYANGQTPMGFAGNMGNLGLNGRPNCVGQIEEQAVCCQSPTFYGSYPSALVCLVERHDVDTG